MIRNLFKRRSYSTSGRFSGNGGGSFSSGRSSSSKSSCFLTDVIVENKLAGEKLEKQEKELESKLNELTEELQSRLRQDDRRGALSILRRKKLIEYELDQLSSARLTVEQQVIILESAQTQQMAVGALANGLQAQKLMNRKLNLPNIDTLMFSLNEQNDRQKEISTIISQKPKIGNCEEELINELDKLQEQEFESRILELESTPTLMPNRNSNVIIQQEQGQQQNNMESSLLAEISISSSEEEIRKLQAEFAL